LDDMVLAHLTGTHQAAITYTTSRGAVKTFAGIPRLGSYTPGLDNLTRWGCIDFDAGEHKDALANPQAVAVDTMATLQAMGVPSFLERSGGGAGFHVWVFFADPVQAYDIRRLLFGSVSAQGVLVDGRAANPKKGLGVEVFPKQDALDTTKRTGNMVWLPWWSEAPDGANQFYRPNESEGLDPDPVPEFEGLATDALDAILATVEPHTVRPQEPTPGEVPEQDATKPPGLALVQDIGQIQLSPDRQLDRLRDALGALNPDTSYDEWLRVGMALNAWSDGTAGLELWDDWSQQGDKYKPGVTTEKWGSFGRDTSVQVGTIFRLAQAAGWDASIPRWLEQMVMDQVQTDQGVVPIRSRMATSSGRPQIATNDRQIRNVMGDAWTAVHQANNPPVLYQRSGLICHVTPRTKRRGPQIQQTNQDELFGRLARVADWVKEFEAGVKHSLPPKDVVRDMLVYPDRSLPTLDTIVTVPVFSRSGKLLATPGYHQDEGVILDPDPDLHLEDIPEHPRPEQVAEAVLLIKDGLLRDFPFVADSDRAGAMAMVILPFARRLIDGCSPLHLIDAPSPGSGKTLLASVGSIVTTGHDADSRPLPMNDDEARKSYTSELASGRPIVLLDNARERIRIDSPALASILTARTWTDRILGETRHITLPNDAMWILTANNPRLSMELARRCVRIRIDAHVERPWQRGGFLHDDLPGFAKRARSSLIRSVLIIIQHWVAEGRPMAEDLRLGSYEAWSQIMGGILRAAGVQGFLQNLETLYEDNDTDGVEWREFTQAWWNAYGDEVVRPVHLNDMAERDALLSTIRRDGTLRSQQTRLGLALQSMKDRIYLGLQITIVMEGRTRCYKLTPTGDTPAREQKAPAFDGPMAHWTDLDEKDDFIL